MLNPAVPQDAQDTKDWTPARVIFTVLTAFNLLSYLWILAIGAGINSIPTVIWIARIASVPLAVYLGKLWKDRGFQILGLYFLWFTCRLIFFKQTDLFRDEAAQNILSGMWLFTACYGLGRILKRITLSRFLLALTSVWAAGMVAYSCAALYAAWNDYHIYVAADNFFGLLHGRLMMIYVPTTAGAILSLSSIIIMITAVAVRNRIGKILLLLAELPILLTLSMTDSRTALINLSVGMSMIVFIALIRHLRTKPSLSGAKRMILSLTVALASLALILLVVMQFAPLFNRVKQTGLISSALAERPKVGWTVVEQRGFSGDNVLNGRLDIWKSIIGYIRENPLTLLTGRSKVMPLQGVNAEYAHCHCLALQILLESGLPGLLMVLVFVFYTLKNSYRILRSEDLPLWLRMLPAVPVSLWIVESVETFTWLRSSHCPMVSVLFVSAGILCAQAPLRRRKTGNTIQVQ